MKRNKLFVCASITVVIILCAATACLQYDGKHGNQHRSTATVEDLTEYSAAARTLQSRYEGYAERASQDGNRLAAGLFRALAHSSRIHENSCVKALEILGGRYKPSAVAAFAVRSTQDNLQRSIADAYRRLDTLRGAAVTRAIASGNNYAARIFIRIDGCTRRNIEMLERCLREDDNDSLRRNGREYEVCPTCGNPYEADNCDVYCPFCHTHRSQFARFGRLKLD